MFYKKQLAGAAARSARLEFADFSGGLNLTKDESNLPVRFAANTYNFDCGDGALKDGLGVRVLEAGDIGMAAGVINYPDVRAKKLHHYRRYDFVNGVRDDRIIMYASDGMLYQLKLDGADGTFDVIEGAYFETEPVFVNYRLNGLDVVIASSSKDVMWVFDGAAEPYRVESAPHISSMAIHYERLFASAGNEGNSLWFSDDLDPTVWDINLESAGFIEMADERGALLKVISFLDYLYVFREFGISRVSAYYDQTQFSVSQLFTAAGRISPESVVLCGDRIIFLASDGVYAFDGLSATRIMPELKSALVDRGKASACYYEGCYYLACYMDYKDGVEVMCERQDGFVNNTIIKYDIKGKSVQVTRGLDIMSFAAVKTGFGEILTAALKSGGTGRVYIVDRSGAMDGEALPKVWTSPYSDLGRADSVKTVTAMYVRSKQDCTVVLKADGAEYRYKVSGGDRVSRIKTTVGGRLFACSFLADNCEVFISRPVIQLKTM